MEEALCWGLSFPQLFPQKSCRILYRMKAYITKGFNTQYIKNFNHRFPGQNGTCTGKYVSEALILESIKPQYDDRLFIES